MAAAIDRYQPSSLNLIGIRHNVWVDAVVVIFEAAVVADVLLMLMLSVVVAVTSLFGFGH